MANNVSLAIRRLHEAEPDRDFILISDGISREVYNRLSRDLAANKRFQKATVFLNTRGGDPDRAFRIGRCLRHHYKEHVRIVVPNLCKSAGTLIAIVGDEIRVGDFGELGPLDIQVYKGSELAERSSGLDITEAFGAVTNHVKDSFHMVLKETRSLGLSTKLSAEFASQVTAAIAAPLFGQLDPLRFGELSRMTRVAGDYGQRLNQYTRNLKDDALQTLIHGYPSHSFVIDRKEAKELFHRVSAMSELESQFCETIWFLLAEPAGLTLLLQSEAEAPQDGADQSPDSAVVDPAPEPAHEEHPVAPIASESDAPQGAAIEDDDQKH